MWLRFLDRVFSRPWSLAVLTLLAVLVTLPTRHVGLVGDDYIHRTLLLGHAAHPHRGSLFDLFTFVDGQADHIQALKEQGRVQWWAADDLKLSFWRPVTELTQWLDYTLWPDNPVLLHLHSIVWWGLLVYLLGRLYRMLDPDPVRNGLAVFLFAFSSLHLFIVAWLAARNQLVAANFVVLTLMAYHRWRSGGRAGWGVLAALCLGLGLLSAEAAIATLAYLVAYALVYEQGRAWGARLWALLPFLLMVAVWRLTYTHLGYGSTGSGAYIDPGADLPRFAHALAVRLPTLLQAQLWGASASLLSQLPAPMQPAFALAAAASVALGLWAARRFGAGTTPVTRFYLLGALLALVPVCAAEPSDRLLLNAELGLNAVLAAVFVAFWQTRAASRGWLAWLGKAVVVLLMLVHLIVYPLMTVGSSLLMARMMKPTTHDEPLSLPAPGPEGLQHAILLNPPAPMLLYYYPVVRAYFHVGSPASMQALAGGNQALTLTRLDAHTLRLQGDQGFGDTMSRDFLTRPFKPGEVVRAGPFTVHVEAVTPEGMAKVVRFVFASPLDDRQLAFYAWGEDGGYVPLPLPAIGQTVHLPKVDLGKLVARALKGD